MKPKSSRLILGCFRAAILCVMLGAGSLPVLAADEGDEPQRTIGLGVNMTTAPYAGMDNYVFPMPLISVSFGPFFIEDIAFGVVFAELRGVYVSAFFTLRLLNYEPGDSNSLTGMEERDMALDGGISMDWENNGWGISISFVTDVTDTYNGEEASLFVYKVFNANPWSITPRTGLVWQSEDLVDYYYGVRPEEATATRPAYKGTSATNIHVGLEITYALSKRWLLSGDVNYERLDGEITGSPIVDEDGVLSVTAGLGWRF